MKYFPFIFSFIFFGVFTSNAGPWLKKKGESYSQLSFSYMKANSLFHISDPDPITLRRNVFDHTLGIYSEYGVSEKFNLIAYFPFKFIGSEKEIFTSNFFSDTLPAGSLTGLGNTAISLKFKIHESKYIWSGQLKLETPDFSSDVNKGLQTGHDTWTIHPALLAGRSWDKTFIAAESGFRFRGNDYSDEFYGNIEFGYHYKKLWLIGVIEARQSMFNRTRIEPNFLQTGLYTNNQEYFSPGIKLNLEMNQNLFLTAGLYGAFSGNYVMHFPSLNIGLAYEKTR